MTRLKAKQARDYLRAEIARLGADCEDGIVVNIGSRIEARSLDWWYEGETEEAGTITKRTIALFRTYLAVAGGSKLYAVGLPLSEKGRIWMDKYVIRRLHEDGYLSYEMGFEPYFEPTAKAAELLVN